MKLRTALVAATMLAAPAVAFAQPITGPYVSLGVGANIYDTQKLSSITTPDGARYKVDGSLGQLKTDADIIGGGAVGWGFGNGFRVEVEGDYRQNALRSINGLHASGTEEQWSGFVNGYYDFDLTPYGLPGLAPFIGAGVGYSSVNFHNVYSNPGYYDLQVGGTPDSVAVQGIVGIAYNIADIPGLALTAEYRFTALPENLKTNVTLDGDRFSVKTNDLTDNAGLVGIRYALWQPAPPPPPPPAPPPAPAAELPARTYLVFFDWDRADLTARARQIVAEAAQASTHVQTTKIEVNGYTDLSGTAAYNQRLSVRRAQSVEAELVKDGVAESEIAIHGYGESDPLVPTAKGVREPQNRRVEIILK
jgi:outer membrane protein OmpA-like peptidoglycan-associated protein